MPVVETKVEPPSEQCMSLLHKTTYHPPSTNATIAIRERDYNTRTAASTIASAGVGTPSERSAMPLWATFAAAAADIAPVPAQVPRAFACGFVKGHPTN